MALSEDKKKARELRRHLRDLTRAVDRALGALDSNAAWTPGGHARGKALAHIANGLDVANDLAKHFGLGLPLKATKAAP